ncbi:MAG TPA: hypothetical protein VMS75_10560, partial [Terriglobales bacterium]|nr:hypothetical protein [Terriglobales bacterium]
PRGRACFVFPERRREDFLAAARASGLRVKRWRSVRPRAGEPSNLFLAELGPAGGAGRGGASAGGKRGAEVMPPLLLFKRGGGYTMEAEAIFSGRPD